MGAKGNNTHQFHTRKVKGYVTLKKVRKTLNMVPWGRRVTVYLVERDKPSLSHEGTGEEYRWPQRKVTHTSKWFFFRSYIDKPISLGHKFHLIIGDSLS